MKHLASLLLCFFCALTAFSQERQPLWGEVTSESRKLENVHVKNITTRKYTLTNAEGVFLLNSKAGDTLVLSHVGMEDLIKFVIEADMASDLLHLEMTPVSNELNEVLINRNDSINAVSLGIIKEMPDKLSYQERALEGSKIKLSDFMPDNGTYFIPIGKIFNWLSGRNKQLRQNIEREKKIQNQYFMKATYSEFLQKELQLTDGEILHFIDYLVENPRLQIIIDTENEAKMHFFLHDQWILYQNEVLKGTFEE